MVIIKEWVWIAIEKIIYRRDAENAEEREKRKEKREI